MHEYDVLFRRIHDYAGFKAVVKDDTDGGEGRRPSPAANPLWAQNPAVVQ